VLTQEDHPVTSASHALTQEEQWYSQIEKELIAQVFGLEHNHQYVYGRNVVIYNDHKPPVSIPHKPLASSPKRLQRLFLCLHQYDIDIAQAERCTLQIPYHRHIRVPMCIEPERSET